MKDREHDFDFTFQTSLVRWIGNGESSVLLLEVVHHAGDGNLAVGGEVDGGQGGGEGVHGPEMSLDLALESNEGIVLLGRDLGSKSSKVNCRSCNTGCHLLSENHNKDYSIIHISLTSRTCHSLSSTKDYH